jgi:hypothetical protein
MSALMIVLLVGLVAYFTLDKRERRVPGWAKIILVLVALSFLANISEELVGIVLLALLVWWFVRRSSRKKARRVVVRENLNTAVPKTPVKTSQPAINPIQRFATTKKRQAALLELNSTPSELIAYIDREIDTFFMNEWTKMSVIYSDETGQFDEDVQENAGRQMREILNAIFAKFARQKRAELSEKQLINDELKAQHKAEIDIAMQVYDKWQDKT